MPTVEEQGKDFTAVTSSGRRLAFLDVLRGLAALAVLFQHLYQGLSPAFNVFSQHWLNFGAFGVALFFLVSGFIIPASLEKHRSLREFWRGRLFRLFPLYLFVLIVVLITDAKHLTPTMDPGCHPRLWCIAANTTMMEEYVDVGPILAVAWTLGLEMVFYILCSVAFALGWLRHSRALVLWSSGVLLVLTGAGLLSHRSFPAGRLGLLATCFLGTLLYRVYKGAARMRDPVGAVAALGISAGWFLAALRALPLAQRNHRLPLQHDVGGPVLGCGVCAVLLAVCAAFGRGFSTSARVAGEKSAIRFT